jgi:hypothetical protein
MKYEDYMRSNKPLRISGVALAVTSLFPLSAVILEGWHTGVASAAFFAFQVSVLIPGIYLLRPLVFWIWLTFAIIAIWAGNLTVLHYWTSVPDWMDAEIPAAVTMAIKVSLWLFDGSSVVLGIFGWLKYRLGRMRTHNPNSEGI